MRRRSREDPFVDLFTASAQLLVEAADLLGQLLGRQTAEERGDVAAQLTAVERRADDATHELVRRLNSTFVTPFDRQDIYALAVDLDDCMDHMDAAAQMVVLYAVGPLPDGVADQVAVLQRQAELTSAAMGRLRSMRDLADYWVEVNQLENAADRTYRGLVAELFAGERDVVRLMKVREVVEELEAAANAFEKVAHTVEAIAVKDA